MISPFSDFIIAWQQAKTVREVCEKFQITRTAALSRAWRLRKRGIPLIQHETTDWEQLKELAEAYGPGGKIRVEKMA